MYLPFSHPRCVRFRRQPALARHWSAKDFNTYSRAKIGYRCLTGPYDQNRLAARFWKYLQNCETGEGREEMFERMSTEDKVRMDYIIGELEQFGDGVQQPGDDPIESSSVSRRKY